MHNLIAGMTLSGKTNAAKCLAREYQRNGISVVVLDPLADPEWRADFQTRKADEFLECVKKSRSLAVFIDESGETIGKYDDHMFWLATRARHYGHKSHFVTQRPQQLSRTVWTQCTDLFLFNISEHDAKLLSEEWNQRELRQAFSLSKYECFHARKMGGLTRLSFPDVKTLDSVGEGHDTSASDPIRNGDSPDNRGTEVESNEGTES